MNIKKKKKQVRRSVNPGNYLEEEDGEDEETNHPSVSSHTDESESKGLLRSKKTHHDRESVSSNAQLQCNDHQNTHSNPDRNHVSKTEKEEGKFILSEITQKCGPV